MKKVIVRELILIAILTTALSYSQNLPQGIKYNTSEGVFITYALMDSISVKLIDRNFLIKENKTLQELTANLKEQTEKLQIKSNLHESQAQSYNDLFNITMQQKNLLHEANKAIKKKARKDKFLFFGGGLSLGALGFAIIAAR